MFASSHSSASSATLLVVTCSIFLVALSMASPGPWKPSPRRLPASRIRPGMRRPNRAEPVNGLDEVVAGTLKRQTMQLMCPVEHFPPPDQHIFCCRKRPDCDCPRRMGVCAEDVEPEPPSKHDDSYIYDYDFNSDKFDKNVDCFLC